MSIRLEDNIRKPDGRIWTIAAMTAADARAIVEWRYPPPYDFYDMSADPEDLAEFMDPQGWGETYFAVRDETGVLLGFFEFLREGAVVTMGLGLRPDLTGRGMGTSFVQAGMAFAAERWRPERFRLFVAVFNQRAIRVYGRVGFVAGATLMRNVYGTQVEFLEMSAASLAHVASAKGQG